MRYPICEHCGESSEHASHIEDHGIGHTEAWGVPDVDVRPTLVCECDSLDFEDNYGLPIRNSTALSIYKRILDHGQY